MKLNISHRTSYRYRRPVALTPHVLIVTPRESGDLRVLARSIRCEPEASLAWTMDVFGNLIATATFADTSCTFAIVSEAVVEMTTPEWPIFAIDPVAHGYPFAYSLDDVFDLGALAQRDWLKPDGGQVGEWARAFVMAPKTDTLSLLKDLKAGILNNVAYRVRDEEGTQLPAETLRLESGSCRDIAALFIEAARHLGFGARAVSGYLFDPDQVSDDFGSTHAWAEIYLPEAGWIAFDPTHRRVGGANLIPVAVARLNRQVMPVSGGYVGAADDFLTMDVKVRVDADD